jgi:hypothetical protein
MSPSRADVASFGATRNDTSPVPWPEPGDTADIQLTELEAVHAHSGCVVIENLLAPPAASIAGGVVIVI